MTPYLLNKIRRDLLVPAVQRGYRAYGRRSRTLSVLLSDIPHNIRKMITYRLGFLEYPFSDGSSYDLTNVALRLA